MLQGHSAREVRVGDRPTISVLLTSTGQRADLEASLVRLIPVCRDLEVQLVVVRACGDQEFSQIRSAFPTVHFAPAPPGLTAADLRVIGMAQAEGDIVVLSDDGGITTDELIDRFSEGRRDVQ